MSSLVPRIKALLPFLIVALSTVTAQEDSARYYFSFKNGPSSKVNADYWQDIKLVGPSSYYYKQYNAKTNMLTEEGLICVTDDVYAVDLKRDFHNKNYNRENCGSYKVYREGGSLNLTRDYSNPDKEKTTKYYYHNGQLKSVEEAIFPKEITDRKVPDLIQFYYDSLGVPMVENGMGMFHYKDNTLEEHGKIYEGMRVGTWTGVFEGGNFTETYGAYNEVVSGRLEFPNGETHHYTTAEDVKRINEMNYTIVRQVARLFKYPEKARQQGIQGRMFVSFVIEKDGEITQVKMARGVHPLLDPAGIEAVKAIGRLHPVLRRGIPVRFSFTVPINAMLQ